MMTRSLRLALTVVLVSAGLAAAHAAGAQSGAPAGDPQHGRTVFIAEGCYECHDYNGEGPGRRGPGANPGPMIAPAPIAWAAFIKQVRTPREKMPPYSVSILSDRDAADIYAYLESLPPRKDADSIPVLAQIDPARNASPIERGRIAFSANCAECHGANAAGSPRGPSLVGEKSKRDLSATIALIKHPPNGMTALYPGLLTDREVDDVASYVQSL